MVGKHGTKTHLYSEEEGDVLCKSGKNAGRYSEDADRETVLSSRRRGKGERDFYRVFGRDPKTKKVKKSIQPALTCYRCAKLAKVNMKAGRSPWKAG